MKITIVRLGLKKAKYFAIIAKRLFDVGAMMFLVQLWPRQAYRFSTRKCLPSKNLRFKKNNRLQIPYELVISRTSNIPQSQELNIVCRGSSFDAQQIEKLNAPIYLVSFWAYQPIFKSTLGIKKDAVYVLPDSRHVRKFLDLGLRVLFLEVCGANSKGEIFSYDAYSKEPWYEELFNNPLCQRISILEKLYRRPESKSKYWAPTGSVLPTVCALSYFTRKVNVYGWDFYLKSSPDSMGYWQLYFNLYNFKLDILRSRSHFESGIINYYYGYQLSKMPNIDIHGYLGQLSRHQKLIGKFDKVLFSN